MNRNAVAALLTGIIALGYLGLMVFTAITGPEKPKSAANSEFAGIAQSLGDSAIFSLTSNWSESSLANIVDGRVHKQTWYTDFASKLKDHKFQYGKAKSLKSQVRLVPSADNGRKIYDYHAATVFEHDTGNFRLLIERTSAGLKVMAIDLQQAPVELEKDDPASTPKTNSQGNM